MTDETITERCYRLGRAYAAEKDALLDHRSAEDEDAAEASLERLSATRAEIEALPAGWDRHVERGYTEARAEYAAERMGGTTGGVA